MDLNAWLTLIAVFISPIVAVGLSLWIEHRRRDRDGKLLVLRQLLITRHLPGDPSYSAAVNLVPLEFNNDRAVIAEYKAYQEAIRAPRSDNPEALTQAGLFVVSRQTKMIFAIMRSLKLKASEADLPIEAYAADGMILRDNLYLDSLRAQLRIAAALERAEAVEP